MEQKVWIGRFLDVSMRVVCYGNGLVRVTRCLGDNFGTEAESPMQTWSVTETAGSFLLSCEGSSVRINKATGALTFMDPEGSVILKEPVCPAILEPKETDEKAGQITGIQFFEIGPDDTLSGSVLKKTGDGQITGAASEGEKSYPILRSSAGWEICFLLSDPMRFMVRNGVARLWVGAVGAMDWLFRVGNGEIPLSTLFSNREKV